MSAVSVSCAVELRGFSNNAVDEVQRGIYLNFCYRAEDHSISIAELFLEWTGSGYLHNELENVISSTPIGEIVIDIDPHTKEFRSINDVSVIDWTFRVYEKTYGQMHK